MNKEKEFYMKLGKNIRKYRLLYSATIEPLTQKDLANKIGVSSSLIGCLESNKINQGISIYNLYKLSEVLNIDINKFFE